MNAFHPKHLLSNFFYFSVRLATHKFEEREKPEYGLARRKLLELVPAASRHLLDEYFGFAQKTAKEKTVSREQIHQLEELQKKILERIAPAKL